MAPQEKEQIQMHPKPKQPYSDRIRPTDVAKMAVPHKAKEQRKGIKLPTTQIQNYPRKTCENGMVCDNPMPGPWIPTIGPSMPISVIVRQSQPCEMLYDVECRAPQSKTPIQVTCDVEQGFYCSGPSELCQGYRVRAICCDCAYAEKISPTKIAEQAVPVPVAKVAEGRPIPPTKISKMKPKQPQQQQENIQPTKVYVVPIPIKPAQIRKTKKPVFAELITVEPKPHIMEEYVPPVSTVRQPMRPPARMYAETIPAPVSEKMSVPRIQGAPRREFKKPVKPEMIVQAAPGRRPAKPEHIAGSTVSYVPVKIAVVPVADQGPEVATEMESFPAPDKGGIDCHFPQPVPDVVTECYDIPKEEEVCTEERVAEWKSAMKSCAEEKAAKRGYSISNAVDRKTLQVLKSSLRSCLRIVGDTSCATDDFSWVVKSDKPQDQKCEACVVIDGAVQISESMKKCVLMVDEETLETCYPGLHAILNNIIVKEMPQMGQSISQGSDSSCLEEAFCDCTDEELKSVMEFVEKVLGVCLPLTGPDACSGRAARSAPDEDWNLSNDLCDDTSYEDFSDKLENCWRSLTGKFENFPLRKKMTVLQKCVEDGELDCLISRYDILNDILSNILFILKENSVTSTSHQDEVCLDSMTLRTLGPCAQNLVFVSSSVTAAGALSSSRVMQSVAKCFNSVLRKCPEGVRQSFLSILQTITFSPPIVEDANDVDRPSYESIRSVIVKRDQVSVCGNGIMNFQYNDADDDQPAKDMCVPILTGPGPPEFILLKSCRSQDVKSWMRSVTDCMDPTAYKEGLSDPDKMGLEKVLELLQSCVGKGQHLQCRPKDPNEFKRLINSYLLILKRFAMNSGETDCIDQLNVDSTAKCLTNMWQFLVMKQEVYALQRQEHKSHECLKSSLSSCPVSFVDGILISLRDSIQLSTYQLNQDTDFSRCDPGTGFYDDSWQYLCEKRPSAFTKRHIERGKRMTHNMTTPNEGKSEASQYCSPEQYSKYFGKISHCQRAMQKFILYPEMQFCNYEWFDKYLESLALCFLENVNTKFPCEMTERRHVHSFLSQLSGALFNVTTYEGTPCFDSPACLNRRIPPLSKCTDEIFNALTNPNPKLNQVSMINRCLQSVWPSCSNKTSMLALPSVYVPLALDLTEAVVKDENRICLTDVSAKKDLDTVVKCTDEGKKKASHTIPNCIQRANKKLKEKLVGSSDELHWDVLPLAVCLTIHPVLECTVSSVKEFQHFMHQFFKNIQTELKDYVALFKDKNDRGTGEQCLKQFSSPELNSCYIQLFEYMNGQTSGSSFPEQCIDSIFEVCGDPKTFHLLMRKSLNMTDRLVPQHSTCIKKGFQMQLCSDESFEEYVSLSRECFQHIDVRRNSSQVAKAVEVCQKCVQKDRTEPCYYTSDTLMSVIAKALTPVAKCLRRHGIEDSCIDDIRYKVKESCFTSFHSFLDSLMGNTVATSVRKAKEFHRCITREITECPESSHWSISTLFNKIVGIENLAIF